MATHTKRIKQVLGKIQNYIHQAEDRKMLSFVQPDYTKILDVGCGQGRYLIPLAKMGFDVTGVDVSRCQVEELSKQGHKVLLRDSFESAGKVFHCIIMSHVIEHVNSADLVGFMDHYLDTLVDGGVLIVATPLLHPGFYDDYDHIRPYTPAAIATLFGDYPQQQEKPRCRLKLEEVWIRKEPIVFNILPVSSRLSTYLTYLSNVFFLTAYIISGKFISRKTGWIGLFRKSP